MLRNVTRSRIKSHNWNKDSNKSQFFQRIQEQSDEAIKDLTLIAKNMKEEQLKEIFSKEQLEPLILALLRPELSRGKKSSSKEENDRVFSLCCMLLKWSLAITGTKLDNKWARELYDHQRGSLRDLIASLYYERFRKSL